MINISKIERSNRKTLSIVVTSEGEVVIKAPLRLPLCEIQRFVQEKSGWIENKLAKIKNNTSQFSSVINYQKLLVFGNICTAYRSKSVKNIVFDGSRVLVCEKWPQDKLMGKINSWYKKLANDYIISRVHQIAEIINLKPGLVKCTGSRGRWGACNNNKHIMINYRAVMLPKRLIDYIIVHELAHLVHLNHSKEFWALVGEIMPAYPSMRKELKQYGFALKLF